MNIFFDLDGTILDISRKYYLVHTLAARIIKIKPLPFKKYWSLKRKKIPENKIINIDLVSKNYKIYTKERIKFLEEESILVHDSLFPGALRILRDHKKGTRLYLITLRRERSKLEAQLNNLGIGVYFYKILSAAPSKDPIVTKIALFKKINYTPDDISIGDTEVDIEVAKKLGIKSVAVYNGIRDEKFLKNYKPDILVKNISEYFKRYSI